MYCTPELKVGAARDGDADACINGDHPFSRAQLAPHLAAPVKKIPDFLDRPVGDGDRCLSWGEFKVGEAAAIEL